MNAEHGYLEAAHELDRARQPLGAAWAYELSLREPQLDVERYLDLAGLYVALCDIGYSTSLAIPPSVLPRVHKRAVDVLDEATHRFGNQPEIAAWRLYALEEALFRDVPLRDYENLARDAASLMARFVVYVKSGGRKYRSDMRAMAEWAKDGTTERKRHIGSTLASRALQQGLGLE